MSPLRGVRKGNGFAGQVAEFLGTERRVLSGTTDKGDLVLKKWVAEVKCPGRGRPVDLAMAMREAKLEAANAGVERYCAITRYTGHGVAEAFVTVPLWLARDLGIPE